MKIEFLKEFEAKTTTGTRIVTAGTVADLAEEKAVKLIAAGVAKVAEELPPFNPTSMPYVDHRGRLIIPFDCPPKYRYWSGGQSLRDTLREIFEERAAIMQFEGKLSREEAEAEAARVTSKYVSDYVKTKGA